MTTTNSLARNALFAALFSPGIAAAAVTGAFDLDGSYVDASLQNDEGSAYMNGALNNNGVASGTGASFNAWGSTGIAFAATTSGGIDDPTNGDLALVGTIGNTPAGLSVALFAYASSNGNSSLYARVVFDIVTPDDGAVAFQIDRNTPLFDTISFSSLSGSLVFDDAQETMGTITTGRYQVEFDDPIGMAAQWELVVVPAPAGAALLLCSAVPLATRRRR